MTQPRALVPAGLDATLALVRHGRSTWIDEGRFQGRADPPLAVSGEAQAAALAARLGGGGRLDPLPPTAPLALWTSPLQRAHRTAAHLADLGGWPEPRPLEVLTEIGQGVWEGEVGTEVARRWPAELAAWRRDPTAHHAPGGEPVVDAAVRVRTGLTTVLDELAAAAVRPEAPPPGSRSPVPGYGAPPPAQPWAVVVAHDGVLRLALLALLDLPLASFWRFPFVLAGLTVIEIHGGGPMLRAHNLAEHLAALTTPAPTEGPRPGAL